MAYHTQPTVTLVGAGPGDPELITLKGWRALQRAQVVLYDSLVSPELLNEIPAGVRKICVGKRAGKTSFRQEDINRLMVECALQYGHVVRLKGGDPFVFGRGHEELAYLTDLGITVHIIPGLSSSIALPGLQGVPVTRRHINESFWVLTGTTKTEKLSEDIRLAAGTTATLIILMGMRKLPQIAAIYKELGRGDIPAMVVQNGSLPDERYVVATIAELPAQVAAAGIGRPGIIVVGATVGLHRKFQKAFTLPAVDQPVITQV